MKTVCEMNSDSGRQLNNPEQEKNNNNDIVSNIYSGLNEKSDNMQSYNAYANFDFLFGKYFSRLAYFINKNIPDSFDDATNISQDAFMIFYKKVQNISFENEKKAVSYLFQIARNLIQNHNRKGHLRKLIDNMIYFFESSISAGNKFEEAEIKTDFDAAISRIPETYKETLILKHIAELEISEIARILDLNEGTVKSRIFNGNMHLAKFLYEYKPRNCA